MIERSEAFKVFLSYSSEETPRMVADRLLRGEHILSSPSRWQDVPPEDFLAQVLRCEDTPAEIYDQIISACKSVASEAPMVFESQHDVGAAEAAFAPLERLCRIVEFATPEKLRLDITSLFYIALSRKDTFPDVAHAVFSALAAYQQSEKDAPIWEDLIDEEEFAAFAFNRLVDINAVHPRVKRHLVELWRRAIQDNLDVNVLWLTQHVREEVHNSNIVEDVFREIKEQYPDVFEKLLTNLSTESESSKEPWEQELSQLATNVGESISFDVIFHELGSGSGSIVGYGTLRNIFARKAMIVLPDVHLRKYLERETLYTIVNMSFDNSFGESPIQERSWYKTREKEEYAGT